MNTLEATNKPKLKVGLIMPITEIAGLNETHWEEVRDVIQQSLNVIEEYELNIRLVSHSDEVRVIQTSIVQNIYSDDIVIIDVSAKNANVMFEFGMRLAFDKPFVVIKDDVTPYIFDTGNIQHLEYPRDLRYSKIEKFKEELRKKVISTLKYANDNPNKSLYLEQYGNLKPQALDEKEVDILSYVEKGFKDINKHLSILKNSKKDNIEEKYLEQEIRNLIEKYMMMHEENEDFSRNELIKNIHNHSVGLAKKYNMSEVALKRRIEIYVDDELINYNI